MRRRHSLFTPTTAALALSLLVALLASAGWDFARAQAREPSKELTDLQQLSSGLYKSRDYADALTFAEQALALVVREFGAESEKAAIQTYSLGLIGEAAGNLGKAEQYYAQSVAIRERLYGAESAGTAQALAKLGQVLMRAGRLDAAEPVVMRVLKIHRDLIGGEHSFNASAHAGVGELHLKRGRLAPALASFRQSVRLLTNQRPAQEVVKAIVEDEIRRSRGAFAGLAHAAWLSRATSGASPAALLEETFAASQQAWTTSAASALAKMTTRLGAGDTPLGKRIRVQQDLAQRLLALNAADMAALAAWSEVQRKDPAYKAAEEAFRAASIANSRDTGPIVKRQRELIDKLTALQARCPSADTAACAESGNELTVISQELGRLSAEAGKGAGAMTALHQRLQAAEAALPGSAEFTRTREARLAESQRLDTQFRGEQSAILAAFPDYAALTDPSALSIAEAQALLLPSEAVITILSGPEKSFVWAVSRERAEWAAIEAGDGVLAEHVAALRRGLDPSAPTAVGDGAAATVGFDLARAHALYRLVLGPVSGVLAGKTHLIVVPTGPLTSLPFQVLVTDPPPAAAGVEALSQARWLIQRHALSVLPSVQSLKALRRLAPGGGAGKPFLGIGDPVLKGPGGTGPEARGGKARATTPTAIYRDGRPDMRALAEMQPLPETADEIRTIARILGAGNDSMLLGAAASEARVKATALDDYRVIHFATHGLVAGELSGLAEPALVLTPPAAPSDADDGLLTASEIAALKLGADWVVLSACNTAAGNEPTAEALSGLARAFFYAGGKALLVSHWAVNSEAAVALTTGSFAALARSPKLGRAEALRQTMLAQIAAGQPPSYWAPFVIVGEGGGRQDKRNQP